MQIGRRTGERGQALIESVIFLPLFLLVLFGIIWIVQITVLNERAQIAVRYSGLISNEASPYSGYSLYSLYNNVGTLHQAAPAGCMTPPPDAFTNDSANQAFPGPKSAQFWQPNSGTTTSQCSRGIVKITGGAMTSTLLLLHTKADVSTQKTLPVYLQAAIGSFSTLSATQNFFSTPDETSILLCLSELHNDVSASLSVGRQGSGTTGFTLPLPDSNPSTPVAVDNC